jgi:hypothetical protein
MVRLEGYHWIVLKWPGTPVNIAGKTERGTVRNG